MPGKDTEVYIVLAIEGGLYTTYVPVANKTEHFGYKGE